jgi:hypothetical protein
LTVGKDVTVGMPYDKVHFFDPRTSNRLVLESTGLDLENEN